jgi:hypothetical protein
MFPVKYRWPAFPLDGTPAGRLPPHHRRGRARCRSRTPNVSKFRDWPFEMNDDERKARYVEIIGKSGPLAAEQHGGVLQATFDVWKDYKRSGKEKSVSATARFIGVDGDKILTTCRTRHVLHVVRNPWSAYADTTRRPVPLPLETYMLGWTLNQYFALLFRERFPGRFHVVRART